MSATFAVNTISVVPLEWVIVEIVCPTDGSSLSYTISPPVNVLLKSPENQADVPDAAVEQVIPDVSVIHVKLVI